MNSLRLYFQMTPFHRWLVTLISSILKRAMVVKSMQENKFEGMCWSSLIMAVVIVVVVVVVVVRVSLYN